jgi:hypothetical protein
MKFKPRDKIVFNAETEIFLLQKGYSTLFTKMIIEIVSIGEASIYGMDINTNANKLLRRRDMKSYRLATENELKINQMKQIFK